MIFYLVAYVATTLGAFTVASWIGRKGDECQNVDDWAGLARRRPAIALVMTLFMLSLAGFPPTRGHGHVLPRGQGGVAYSSWSTAVVLVVLAVLVLALGIVPAPFMTLVQ